MNIDRTRLLVSVRSAAEAAEALAGGAQVIDVKEPDRGALGAADPTVWREVLQAVAGRAPVSAALGELLASDMTAATVPTLAAQTAGLSFAKIGLAGAMACSDWSRRWQRALAALPQPVTAVAVAYADWHGAEAPRPEEVIDCGAKFGCRYFLLDTFAKSGASLLDHLPTEAIAPLVDRARQRRMKVVLAGSLTLMHLPQVLPLRPELVAVRGAACQSGRQSEIDASKVAALASALTPQHNASWRTRSAQQC